jgi:diadenosine tetraphosphate (Ap4A) HIT family hydrolase
MEQYPGCEVCEVLPTIPEEFVLAENDHWNANLRDRDQTLLGTSFITLKRHAYELDQLTPDEDTAFVEVRNAVIRALRTSFSPTTFNVSCLKNDAFQADPDNTPSELAHVHYHVKPRYGTQPIEFAGETFTDPSPGRPLAIFDRKKVSPAVTRIIAGTIRTNLG